MIGEFQYCPYRRRTLYSYSSESARIALIPLDNNLALGYDFKQCAYFLFQAPTQELYPTAGLSALSAPQVTLF